MKKINLHWLAPIIFILSLAFYTLTLAPDVLWGGGDFATYQTMAFLGGVQDIRGSAGVFYHPLWVLLAHPFTLLPIQTPAWRANFASAVFAAAALALVFLTAKRLTHSTPASLFSTVTLAVSHTFWTYAVMAKPYSLNALLFIICIYLLLLWREKQGSGYLYGFAFLYGLSFFNHLVMATVAMGFFAYIGIVIWNRRRDPSIWQHLLIAMIAGLAGLSPRLLLLARTETDGSIIKAAMGALHAVLFLPSHPKALLAGIGIGIALLLYQFPAIFPAGFWGLRLTFHKKGPEKWLLGLAALGNVFVLLLSIDPRVLGGYWWNLHQYLLTYVIFALWIAIGLADLWPRIVSKKRRLAGVVFLTVVFPVFLYALTPVVARPLAANVPGFRSLPGRDNFRYALSPWKSNERGARRLGENILDSLPQNSVLFADYSIWAIINYMQVVENARPDVTLVKLPGRSQQTSIILNYRNGRPLFLADLYRNYYDVEGIKRYFEIVPYGPIYRLQPKE